ncbi:MAG: Asp-tRNA(Asn)/Glu-tRNA(Gln) amidotransferase subunit GatA [Acidobacteria bacterium]|nr:Asp-tRNA(Asn)/Glu-tRNA(Gln) amidotransferase subunit GatA [Acidobacteriota bacterium]
MLDSIASYHEALRAGTTTVRATCDTYFERIERLNPSLGIYLALNREAAEARAEGIDREISSGRPLRPLAGVPLAVKDVLSTKGLRTTCGSRILHEYIPPFTATAVSRLVEAGAVILGKTNCDEFAMGSSNENSAFQAARNPWNPECVPGGSSGGSAAAVAARLALVALGTDTGGSVRQPASLCGVVGLKPTYGRVSRYGLIAFGSSLDHVGPLSLRAADAARLLQVMAGRDPLDATSSNEPVPDYLATIEHSVKGLRVGVPREYFSKGLDPEVSEAIHAAIDRLAGLGAEIVEVSLPHSEYAIACYYIIATAEASSNLARFDGVRFGHRTRRRGSLREMYKRTRDEGFGPEVKRRIMLGTYVLSAGYYDAYYAKAQRVRTLLRRDFIKAFERCDVIAGPTSPTVAFKLGEKADDPLSMYLSDIYTITANLAAIPGISFPCGVSGSGLPIGLQLQAPDFREEFLFRFTHQYEQTYPFNAEPNI